MKTNSVTAKTSSIEERALQLLGAGIAPARVAEALNVEPSRISQLLSDDEFRDRLTDVKFDNLQKHNEADAQLDAVEEKIRGKLLEAVDMVYKPMELTRMLQVVNAAKRRGSSAPTNVSEQKTVINLVLPTKIINKFTTNTNNQVVKAGETELLTIQSSALSTQLDKLRKPNAIEITEITQNDL